MGYKVGKEKELVKLVSENFIAVAKGANENAQKSWVKYLKKMHKRGANVEEAFKRAWVELEEVSEEEFNGFKSDYEERVKSFMDRVIA